MISFPTFNQVSDEFLMILVSIIIGLIIGLEREYHNKYAGLRTFILISFSSCIFTILSIKIGVSNPDRIAANIITGIGFLGTGVIFKDDNKITGVTTASSIWGTASLGMCAGSGYIFLAFAGTAIVMIVLWLLAPIQLFIDNLNKIRDYNIESNDYECLEDLKKNCRHYHLKYSLINNAKDENRNISVWRISGKIENHTRLIQFLMKDKRISKFHF